MNTQELYNECHRLFSYDADTGYLIRNVDALDRWGNLNPMPKCKSGDIVGALSHGYLRVNIKGKQYLLHRIIWLMVVGALPIEHIDHINCDKADNRWINLREATNAENGRNRGKQSNNKVGFKGVQLSRRMKNPYMSRIVFNGKGIYLGMFPTPELAHHAYCEAVEKYHGEFANFAKPV